jgi:predicted GIY-YIG superfamily endonuclease
MKGTIYLLHFSQPYKHAKHYIGFARDLSARLESHANGTGARLLQVITEAGLSFELARTWEGSRKTERSLKNRKATPRLCPLCNPQAMKLAKN